MPLSCDMGNHWSRESRNACTLPLSPLPSAILPNDPSRRRDPRDESSRTRRRSYGS
jgi:hypothetical protein